MDTAILYKWSTIAYVIIAIAAIYWAYRAIRSKLDDMRQHEELAELEFENSLYNSSSIESPHTPETPYITSALSGNPEAVPIMSQPAKLNPPEHPESTNQSDIMNHPLIQKLQAARLFVNVEFFREHHGKEKGLVAVKLRNGKIALIVPNWESDAFIQRYEKQVDLIIMPGADGRACVITPFSALIADSVTF